ncbi:LysR family transcriptional regulator [Ferruginivarius sediminum]|uniref:LysR family transcriptional regulator n=1 Tax=Ferruginivarius sediminum TaxID=2661937 RepID=A0A369TF15_9PROT|nr:LysR family transcriptional regulator [Ferruginivarius sediminum]RDD62965.1 LysR family transcriptional regulator [Ferruginivarius sediminum]
MPDASLDRLPRELDWNLLRTFMVIVQEGGITRAADRLLLKQPSVSNALKRLEGQLGRRLIERGPGVFRVTETGERLYRECVEIYGNVSRLSVVLRDVQEEIRGHVTIWMASHVVCPLYDEALAELHARHPRIGYTVEVSTSAEVVNAVLQKSASFGICLVAKQHPKLQYELLFREHFGFFCGPAHRLFRKRNLELSDLREECFVSFKTDRMADALRPVALLRAQAEIDDRIVATSSHLEEVRRMIAAGLGIGVLPIHVVERDVRDGLLWRLPPYSHAPAVDIYVVSNPTTQLNRAEQEFLATLRRRIAETPLEDRTYGA